MTISQLNRNIAMLQLEQTENSKDMKDNIMVRRQRQQQHKLDALSQNKEAADVRSSAKTEQAGYQAVAAGLGIAAAACACIPVVGAVIAAVIAAVAAVVMLVGTLQAKAKEDEAARKEQQAGLQDVMAEQQETQIDELVKADDDRKNYVDQMLAQLKESNQQEAQGGKF